ncbi:MAG: hypothetical protein JSV30_00035 [Candidatus Omnitrophota bacterium]|nr:MAG: hypothetical protein JSV30_00035 [Candidatus Omnitrophota bacterium]
MIKKQELLKILKGALDTEEKSILIYKGHLESAVFWTGIGRDKTIKAKELLGRLAQGSLIHKGIVERLIEEIKENNRDAF